MFFTFQILNILFCSADAVYEYPSHAFLDVNFADYVFALSASTETMHFIVQPTDDCLDTSLCPGSCLNLDPGYLCLPHIVNLETSLPKTNEYASTLSQFSFEQVTGLLEFEAIYDSCFQLTLNEFGDSSQFYSYVDASTSSTIWTRTAQTRTTSSEPLFSPMFGAINATFSRISNSTVAFNFTTSPGFGENLTVFVNWKLQPDCFPFLSPLAAPTDAVSSSPFTLAYPLPTVSPATLEMNSSAASTNVSAFNAEVTVLDNQISLWLSFEVVCSPYIAKFGAQVIYSNEFQSYECLFDPVAIDFTSTLLDSVQSAVPITENDYGYFVKYTSAFARQVANPASESGYILPASKYDETAWVIKCRTQSLELSGSYRFSITVGGQTSGLSEDVLIFPRTPELSWVSGCAAQRNATTIGCPTSGGILLTIAGEHFTSNTAVSIGGNACKYVTFINNWVVHPDYDGVANILWANYSLTCLLPPGTGFDVEIVLSEGQLVSPPFPVLSYAGPTVTGLTHASCRPLSATHLGACPRAGAGSLTLSGINFGLEGHTVILGSRLCGRPRLVNGPSPAPTQYLSCDLPEGTTENTYVLLIQSGGAFSLGQASLDYVQCAPGTYQNQTALDCASCPVGKITAVAGSRECVTCSAGFYSSPDGDACVGCGAGTFSEEAAGACQDCAPGTFATALSAAW
jgi:hypothetical protein